MSGLRRPFNKRAKNPDLEKQFLKAVVAGDEQGVRAALKRHVDVDARDAEGNSALERAMWHGHLEIARLLLRNHADPNAANHIGHTPLMTAALVRQPGFARELLDHGADVNRSRKDGETALTLAAWAGDMTAVDLFVARRANILHQNVWNQDAMMQAYGRGYREVGDRLRGIAEKKYWKPVKVTTVYAAPAPAP